EKRDGETSSSIERKPKCGIQRQVPCFFPFQINDCRAILQMALLELDEAKILGPLLELSANKSWEVRKAVAQALRNPRLLCKVTQQLLVWLKSELKPEVRIELVVTISKTSKSV